MLHQLALVDRATLRQHIVTNYGLDQLIESMEVIYKNLMNSSYVQRAFARRKGGSR